MPDSQYSQPSFSFGSPSSGAAGAQKPPASPKPEQSFLAKAYFWLEDRYYDACDFLQNAGIPVYKYWVEPIESRGVPSFPVTVGVLVLLLLLLWLLMQPAPLVDLAVKVVSAGKVIAGANVSLSYDGNLVWRYSSVSGSASFPGLKPGTRVLLNASKQGYVPVRGNQSFVLENSRTVSFEMIAPSLAGLEQPSNSLVVNAFFRDEKGVRRNLEGVKLVYSSAEGVELGTATTDAVGSLTLLYDGKNSLVFLDLEKEGFEPVRGVGVFFAKKNAEIEMAPVGAVQTARLIVQVRNSKGSAVVSTVSLFSFDGTGPLEVLQTDAAGQAEFSVELGTKAFVNVVPVSNSDKGKYNPYYGEDSVFLVNSSPYNVFVTLKDKDGSFGKAVIRVLEASSNQTLPGVEVTLYDAFSKRYLDKANTDASGEASFGIPNTTTAYATAYASGFLPEGVVNVKAGTTKTVYLRRATSNNSGYARVSVTEQNGTLVSGAFVNLHRYIDEFPLGLPQQATNASGFVVFSSVPLNFDLFAQAFKGARNGRSAGKFIVQPSKTENVTVVLDAGSGNVSASVKDAYSGKAVSGAQVFATASSGGALLSSCTTDANGACLMQVKSYVAFTVVASASGYKNSSSQQVAMAVDSSRFVSLSIVPLGKENELFVNLTDVVEDGGASVSFLERGKTYRAKFVANFPSNLSGANGTFYARLGGEGDASASDFIVLDASASGSVGTARGEKYLPSSCPNEAIANCADASAGGCKWVQLNFANVSGTTANPEVIFKVRPVNVSAAQVASVFYRVFAKVSANGSVNYLRSPADTYLPMEGDSCNATTKAFTIPLAAGVTTCSDNACLTLVFKNSSGEYGEGFETALGSKFDVEVRARQLQPAGGLQFLNLSYSPHAKYISLPSGWSQLLDGTLQTNSQSSIDSSVNFNASIPSLALGARVSANYSLGNLAVSARYTITGADWLVVSAVATQKGVAQTNLYAGEANDLAVSVNTSLGVPVANATVFLNNEDSAGSPAVFNTLPASISGDNSSGKGRDGLYVFAGVVPVNEGKAKVQAVRGISGQTLVDVESRPFLEVSPGFIYVCSATPLPSFKVSNQLATPVQVDIGVRKGCVEKIGPASFPQPDPNFDNYSYSYPNGETTVTITPLASSESDCTIFLNSSFAGQTVERQIQYVSDLTGACDYDKLPSCTLTPSVSGTVGPFPSELSATYSNVPAGITSATIYCNAADTNGASVTLVESAGKMVATRTDPNKCRYDAAPGSTSVLHDAKASISSTPEIQIGAGVGECAAQVTVRPMPTGADFVIDQSGVIMAITPSATMEITPLIPANAIKVSVKNEMAVGPASVLFNYDQACFKLLKLDGSTPASSDYDVPAGATKEYALLFNYEAASCSSPEFTSSGDALRFSKSDLMAETLTAGFGGKTASVSLSVKSSNQDTAVYSLARVAIDPATYSFVSDPLGLSSVFSAFVNNMQASRMNVYIKPNSGKVNTDPLPQKANAFQVLYSKMAARTFVPAFGSLFGQSDQLYTAEFPVHSFNTLQSPNAGSAPTGLVNVKQEIEAAYGVIGLDSPPAQFAVLKLPKSPGIVVPFSTASGKQLYRFDVSYSDQQGYFVEKFDRCSIAKAKIDEGNPTTIGCPLCGASGDPCCTSNPECNGANNYCKQSTRECTLCGTLNKDCCPTGTPCTEEGTVCDPSGTNKCVPCGAVNQPCCSAEPRCPEEWTKCNNEFCEACGGLNQDTCPTGAPCREGSPSGGKCTNYRLYTVTCQDCLSAIAQKCFFDMGEWPVICQHNKDVGRLPQDRDCGLIYVGEILEIPPYSGDQACANACACPAACCGGCCV